MPNLLRPRALFALSTLVVAACAPGEPGGESTDAAGAAGQPSQLAAACEPDDDGLTLPDGFCAIVFYEGTEGVRHLTVRDDGTVLVAVPGRQRGPDPTPAGVLVLRDGDGDGRADLTDRWDQIGGNEVLLDGETVYVAPNDAVVRFTLPAGMVTPSAGPDTVVQGLPSDRNHVNKSLALGPAGELYINIGSASNACQEEDRSEGSPGMDPCPEMEVRAGIWRFDAAAPGQTPSDGLRFATGLRNIVALAIHPVTGVLYGVQNGRDQLHDLYPDLFTVEDNAEKPAEEFVRIEEGDDFGWPYCHFDPETETKVLAPEYGGDGAEVGRCADKKDPIIGFPGHWAPVDLEFYTGTQFPGRYQGGAFIAFHGSWNRAPLPQAGYNVTFVRFEGGEATTDWEVFADGFRREDGESSARPVGVAMGPDGSLYVSDSQQGRIWRIVYGGA
jgi:glucose/arabinose dehydrogenase